MNNPVYSKSQGISSEDVAKCDNPLQLKNWYFAIERDCVAIKDGISFLKANGDSPEILAKRMAALRSQIQLLREIAIKHNEVRHGIYPFMSDIIDFYNAAQKVLTEDELDKVNNYVLTKKGIPAY